MLRKVTHCAGCVSADTRPHQLRWCDREMGTAISCTESSEVYMYYQIGTMKCNYGKITSLLVSTVLDFNNAMSKLQQ